MNKEQILQALACAYMQKISIESADFPSYEEKWRLRQAEANIAALQVQLGEEPPWETLEDIRIAAYGRV